MILKPVEQLPPKLPDLAQLDGPPPVLLPYQQKWIADPSPFKVEEKSRRTGLTWAEAADDVLIAASDRTAGGMNVYYIAYNQDMTVEYVQACAMWARVFNRAAGEIEEGFWDGEDEADKNIKTFTIRFPSGFRIVALTSRPSNLRGRQGVIVIDEAAFHEKLDELLKAAMAMLIWGGKVRVISTHNGVENPFNELITDIRAGKRKGTVHRITFREAVEQGLYRRVCLRLGKAWAAVEESEWSADVYAFYGAGAEEELDCVPSNSGGAWISRALIEARMIDAPVLRWEPLPGFTMWPKHLREAETNDWCKANLGPLLALLDPLAQSGFGEDFGRTGDLTVVAPWQITQLVHLRFPFLLELRNVPFEQQKQILFYLVDRLPRFVAGAMDARGNGQYLAEVAAQKYGATRIEQIMLTETWYREHTAPFKARFEDGTIELPRDRDVMDDVRAFQVVRGVPRLPDTRTTAQDGNKRHGDAGVALLLADYASRDLNKGPVNLSSRSTPGSRPVSSQLGGYLA